MEKTPDQADKILATLTREADRLSSNVWRSGSRQARWLAIMPILHMAARMIPHRGDDPPAIMALMETAYRQVMTDINALYDPRDLVAELLYSHYGLQMANRQAESEVALAGAVAALARVMTIPKGG